MPIVGTAEYILELVTKGAPEFIAQLKQVEQAQKAASTAVSRAAPAPMPSPSRPYAGVHISPADAASDPDLQAAGVVAAATRLSGGGKGRMGAKQAAYHSARQVAQLRSIQEKIVRDTALGNVAYDPDLTRKVMEQQTEAAALGEVAKVSRTPSGKFVTGNVASAIGGMGKEVDQTAQEFESFRKSALLGNQVAQRATSAEKKTAAEKQRTVREAEAAQRKQEAEDRKLASEAKRARRESPLNRMARGASWLLPQQGYYMMGAAQEFGMPPAAMAAVAGTVLTVGTIALIMEQAAKYQQQITGMAAMTGGTGIAPGPLDQQTQAQLALASARMHMTTGDAMKVAGQAAQFGISSAQDVVGGVQIAQNMMQATGMSGADAGKAVYQLMADTGLGAQQLQASLDRFQTSVTKTGTSVQVATSDLLTFAPLLGKSGDFSGIAGLTAFAQTQGLTATQLAGPFMTASGQSRIQQAAGLGMTPDQMMALQQSPGGPAMLTGDISRLLNRWVAQSGFTIAESTAESMGYVTPGPDADRIMRALLAGQSPAAQALMTSGIGANPPAFPGAPGSLESMAAAQNQKNAGFGTQLRTYGSLLQLANGQALNDQGGRWGGIATPGTFLSTLGYFVSDISKALGSSQVAGAGVAATGPTLSLDITMHDQAGNVGHATVPITPGTITSTPNVAAVKDGAPQGGGTNLALPSPSPTPGR